MKPKANFIYKMLKILRFFRRERRSADVSETGAEKGLDFLVFVFFFMFIFSIFLSITDVYSVRIMFVTFFAICKKNIFGFNLFLSLKPRSSPTEFYLADLSPQNTQCKNV